MSTILENANGVRITEEDKMHGHHIAVGALCCCGEHLIVAPTIYQADHRKGDPVMVCGDHGVHAFRSCPRGWRRRGAYTPVRHGFP